MDEIVIMNPNQIAKSNSESAHQQAFFAYCAVAEKYGFLAADAWSEGVSLRDAKKIAPRAVSGLSWVHSVPNGGSRGSDSRSRAITGARMKAEGLRKGVADIFLPMPSGEFHGLYIEMKKPDLKPKHAESLAGLSPEQKEFRLHCIANNYVYEVCYSWKEAASTLKNYIYW